MSTPMKIQRTKNPQSRPQMAGLISTWKAVIPEISAAGEIAVRGVVAATLILARRSSPALHNAPHNQRRMAVSHQVSFGGTGLDERTLCPRTPDQTFAPHFPQN